MENRKNVIAQYCSRCKKGFSVHRLRCPWCDLGDSAKKVYGQLGERYLLEPISLDDLKGKKIEDMGLLDNLKI